MKAYKPKDAVYTRIESGDDWSKVYQHVCGVPTDGTEVQAEAFVLGEARVVEITRRRDGMIDITTPEGGVLTPSCGIEFGDLCFPIGRIKPGETRRIRIVPEPVAAETPSQRAVQAVSKMAEQLVQGDLDDSEGGAGVPVAADIPKGAAEKETEVPQHSWYKPDPCETFLMRYGDSDVWFGTGSDLCSAPYTRRIGKNLDDGGPYPLSIEIAPGEYWWEAAHLAARAKARELGLMESGIVSESKGADVSEKPKVWLMRHRVGGYRVSSGQLQPKYNKDRDTWDVDESGWVKHVPDEIVPLIHPAHNLKPGECCEVPARECQHETLTFHAATSAEPVGPLNANVGLQARCDQCGKAWTGDVRVGTAKAIQHHYDLTEALSAPVAETPEETARIDRAEEALQSVLEWNADGVPALKGTSITLSTLFGCFAEGDSIENVANRFTVCREDIETALQGISDCLAVRMLPVAESGEGPRPPVEQIPCGCSVGEFIGRFSSFERERNYYVGKMNGRDVIVRDGDFSWMPLVDDPPSESHSAKTWIDVSPNDPDAKAFRAAYDTALAANKLHPHPRYPKPEGATDFLGWFGEAPDGSECDGWWNGSDVCVVCSSFGMGWRKLESARLMPRLYAIAAARANELGLPERDARNAKLAGIDRQIAALTAERAGIESEVPSA